MRKQLRTIASMLYWSQTILLASTSSSHLINVSVPELNSISVGSSTLQLTINDYIAGTDTPTGGNTATTTFALTSNSASARYVSVSADSNINNLPAGATISLTPSLGSGYTGSPSAHPVSALSTTAQHVFSGISKLKIPNGSITYTLNSSATAGPIPSVNINVTFTVTNS